MATINIGAENKDDPHYRYKMPKPISKVEGRGNGIRTNVVNNVDIAKALARRPEYILKFLGFELGAQTNFDSKTGTSIVNGAHNANVLMTLIESFIKQYVQCYSCSNPETVISVKKERVLLKCKACGHVSEVVSDHRLNNYITKNPPGSELTKQEKEIMKKEKERLKALEAERKLKKKASKETKKKKSKSLDSSEAEAAEKEAPKTEEEEEEVSSPVEKEAEEDVVWHSDVSAEAIAKRAKEQLTSSAVASMVTQGNIEAEATEAKKKLKKLLAKLEFTEEQISTIIELGSRFYEEQSNEEVLEFLNEAVDKPEIKTLMLYLVLFYESPEKLGSIVKDRSGLLEAFNKSPTDQIAHLVGLEYVMGMILNDRLKEMPQILKVMYDEDIVEEEFLVDWYNKADIGQNKVGVVEEGAEAVRSECKEFIEWLQADDESD